MRGRVLSEQRQRFSITCWWPDRVQSDPMRLVNSNRPSHLGKKPKSKGVPTATVLILSAPLSFKAARTNARRESH